VATVRVLSFNIAIGGEAVDIGQVVEAIVATNADIVGLQECEGNAVRIAALLGWAHVDERHQIVSRWPLVEPHDAGGRYVLVHVEPERVFAMANVHLPSDPYGPYALRDGMTDEDVTLLESEVRGSALAPWLEAWGSVIDAGVPLLVTGDFNAPSHRDWGAHATGHRRRPFAWPVSLAMEAHGFVDVYRTGAPERPGITWTYGFPHPRTAPDELCDRIDFVWSSPEVAVVTAALVGPAGGPDSIPDVTIDIDRWPSDHLAVAGTVELVPVAPPPFVGVLRHRVELGDTIAVRYAAPLGASADRIWLVPHGADTDSAHAVIAPREVEHCGVVRFGTGGIEPGVVDIVLTSHDAEIGRVAVHVVAPGALPQVVGERVDASVVVTWRDAPGRKFDWIGLYALGDPDVEHGIIAHAHTGASVVGRHVFADVPAGPLTVRLLHDDSFAIAAEHHLSG
jgi:endonuclease/exonuclease/phosphatase family metal-dependent hydrolase